MSSTNPESTPPEMPQLSEVDVSILNAIGENVSYGIKHTIAELTVYGAYFVLVLMAAYVIMTRPAKRMSTYWLLAALVLTFCLTTVGWSLDIYNLQFLVKTMITDPTSPSLFGRIDTYNHWVDTSYIFAVQVWIGGAADTGLMFIVNDILATWRALAVWGLVSRGQRILAFSLSFLIFAAFALWLSYSVLSTLDLSIHPQAVANTDLIAVIGIASSSASIAANVLATGMIGYAAYMHNRTDSRFKGPQHITRTKGGMILLLLTESGLFYALIQIVRLALSLSIVESTPQWGDLSTTTAVFTDMTAIVTAMYTPAIILIIHYGYSITDSIQNSSGQHFDGSHAGADKTLSAIEFGRGVGGGTNATTNDELSSGDSSGGLDSDALNTNGRRVSGKASTYTSDDSEKPVLREPPARQRI